MLGTQDFVKLHAANYLAASRGITVNKAKEFVSTLMWRITSPTEPEKKMGDNFPLIRYLSVKKNGFLHLYGEKEAYYGPPSLYDGKRMAILCSRAGGFGGGTPNIHIIGAMYWGKYELGNNHICLGNKYKAPVIYHHAKSPYRNSKRAAVWGLYIPTSIKTLGTNGE